MFLSVRISCCLLRFFLIWNFSTFFIAFNFISVFLFNLRILVFLPFIQTGPLLCQVPIVSATIFYHVGDLLICWLIQIGECKGGFYEINQTDNPKRTKSLFIKMFLVNFSSFPVDRRVKDLWHKSYLRTLERRTVKYELNFDLWSLLGKSWGSIKYDIPFKRVIVNKMNRNTRDGFIIQEIKLLLNFYLRWFRLSNPVRIVNCCRFFKGYVPFSDKIMIKFGDGALSLKTIFKMNDGISIFRAIFILVKYDVFCA